MTSVVSLTLKRTGCGTVTRRLCGSVGAVGQRYGNLLQQLQANLANIKAGGNQAPQAAGNAL